MSKNCVQLSSSINICENNCLFLFMFFFKKPHYYHNSETENIVEAMYVILVKSGEMCYYKATGKCLRT